MARSSTVADAAASVEVPTLVYSSVGGAERATGIPHFESKRRVEEYMHELGLPVTIIRPVFFMDNFGAFLNPSVEDGVSVLRAPLASGVPLQMIAVADIGAIGASALTAPESIDGGAMEIAGDELTPERIAEELARRSGLPARFEPVPLDAIDDPDQRAMFSWFARYPAYQADIAATGQLAPALMDFSSFLAVRG